jgi:short-subunit dehydrogenase
MQVKDKVIVVTGAADGMGRELTLELVRRGAKIAAVDLSEERLEALEAEVRGLGGQSASFVLDVTDAAGCASLPERVAAALGEADGLINNAGIIQPFVKVELLEMAAAERVMNVNFTGPLQLIKAFLPGLLTRPEAHILNVASMGAYAPVPGQSVYGASKAAIKLLTEGLRSELMETKVGVTIAFPGAVATSIAKNSGIDIPGGASEQESKFKAMPADAAAKIMVDAIEGNKPRVTVGKDATFMDRLSRLSPVGAANLIYKQMKSLLG